MNNFVSVFEELSKLYEEDTAKVVEKETDKVDTAEQPLKEDAGEEAIIEDEGAAEEADFVEEPAEDAAEEAAEEAEESVKKLVLECTKCGSLICKDETEVQVDEETDLANIEEACKSCEEAAGYKILGELVPYEDAEPVEEALEDDEEEVSDPAFKDALMEAALTEGKFLDNIKKVATRVGADATTIVRCFAELGDTITGRDSKFYDFAEYVENKAALKALMNGNEKVLNTLTKEDIEELKDDIAAYEKAKADKKAGIKSEDEDLE